jgi:hypothetical protein
LEILKKLVLAAVLKKNISATTSPKRWNIDLSTETDVSAVQHPYQPLYHGGPDRRMHTEIGGEHGHGIKAFIADRKIAFSNTGGKIRILLKIAYFPTCFLHLIVLKFISEST